MTAIVDPKATSSKILCNSPRHKGNPTHANGDDGYCGNCRNEQCRKPGCTNQRRQSRQAPGRKGRRGERSWCRKDEAGKIRTERTRSRKERKPHAKRRTTPWPSKTERQKEAFRLNKSLYQSGAAVRDRFGAGTKKDGGGKKG